MDSIQFIPCEIAFTMAAVMITVFAQLRALKLFAFHPILMSIGTIIFIAEGIVAHSNHNLVDILGPIMQHNKKTKIRVIHQNLNTIGGCFLGLGLLFMFANKFVENKSMLPQTPHAICGWIALSGVVCQAVIGSHKLQSIDLKISPKPYKWHGDSGLLLWDILCFTILLGMLEFYHFNVSNVFVELCVLMVWWIVHLQMLVRKRAQSASGAASMNPNNAGLSVDGSHDTQGLLSSSQGHDEDDNTV